MCLGCVWYSEALYSGGRVWGVLMAHWWLRMDRVCVCDTADGSMPTDTS